jgi:hypothetical protein
MRDATLKYCEVMVHVHTGYAQVWTRCGKRPVELHHRLTRARGGLILDAAGEHYHLMYVCHGHHMRAHDQGSAFENGMLLDGYVTTGAQGTPEYRGSDPYLSAKFRPALGVPGVSGDQGGPESGESVRGEA